MYLPNLKSIYQVLTWYNTRQEPGKSVGIFSVLPSNIANQFPKEGKEKEDDSPPHITICYIGSLPLHYEDKLVEVLKQSCKNIKPFLVSLKKPKKFINNDNQIVLHSPVASKKLKNFHYFLKNELLRNLIPVDNKFPEFKPHVTISYCADKDELARYKNIIPEGEWMIDSVWIWGMKNPELIPLGK